MTNDGMIEKLAKNDREANVLRLIVKAVEGFEGEGMTRNEAFDAVRDCLSLMQKWRGLELTAEQIEGSLRQEAAKLARRQFKAVGT